MALLAAKTQNLIRFFFGAGNSKARQVLLASNVIPFDAQSRNASDSIVRKTVLVQIRVFADDCYRKDILSGIYYPDGRNNSPKNFNDLLALVVEDLNDWLPSKPYFGAIEKNFDFENIEASCARLLSELIATEEKGSLQKVAISYSMEIVDENLN